MSSCGDASFCIGSIGRSTNGEHLVVVEYGKQLGKLDRAAAKPDQGQINVGQVLRVIAVHDALHRRDILQLLKEVDRH